MSWTNAHTKNNEVVFHKNEHNHIPNVTEIGPIIGKIKKKTRSSQIEITPYQVIAQISSSSKAISAALSSMPVMKKMVQRIRHFEKPPPPQIL